MTQSRSLNELPPPLRVEVALGVPTHMETGNVLVLGIEQPMAIVDPSSVALMRSMAMRAT